MNRPVTPAAASTAASDPFGLTGRASFVALLILLLTLSVSLGVLFVPCLGPDLFAFGTDTTAHDYPCLRWAWDEIRASGRLPLWCPYLFCGIPTLGTLLFCPFHPLQWLFAVLPFPMALTLQYALAFAVAGAGAHALARRCGLAPTAALFAGVAFGLCSHGLTLTYAGHLSKVLAIAAMPWALAGWVSLCDGRKSGVLLAGAAVATQMLASHPQIACYTVAAGLLWLISGLGSSRVASATFAKASSRPGRGAQAALFAASLILAGLLSGAQLLPLLEMNALSNRAAGLSYAEATQTSFPPMELLELALPRFSGDSVRAGSGFYAGGWGSERIVSDYVGAGVWILAGVGLFGRGARRRWFWAALWGVACAMALGKWSPIYRLAFHALPGVSSFRSPGTVMALMALSTALLAAYGAQRLLDACRSAPSPRTGWVCGAAGLILAVFGACAWFATRAAPGAALTVPWRTAQAASHAGFWGGLSLMAIGLLLSRWARASRRHHLCGLCAVALACAADLVAANRLFIQPESAEIYERYLRLTPPDPLLAQRVPPARMLEWGNELTARRMVNQIASPHGYHPITFARYHELLNEWGGIYDPRALDCFGVDYLLGPPPDNGWPPPGYALSDAPAFGDARRGRFLFSASGRAAQPPLEWRRYAPNEATFMAPPSLPPDGVIRLPEPFAPGWEAWVGARSISIGPDAAHGFFRAVSGAQPGDEVTVRYRPFSFRLGLFGSLIGWAALVALLTVEMRFRAPRLQAKSKR